MLSEKQKIAGISTNSAALEEGTKQRRPNKRYKDYELEDGGADEEQKKNV